jgi:uncharacterized membrane protein YoaT (DUF817 family)
MNAADIELARMVYIASSLAIVLFTSMILRGLWRPLRFVLLALAISILFTPFFVEQAMPDGSKQNIVPAFIVMAHNGASDREHWQQAIQHAGKPIVVVAGIASFLALVLALLLPKKKKPAKSQQTANIPKTALPATPDTKNTPPPQQQENPDSNKKTRKKKYRKKKKNPYLPDDFQPQ